MKKFAIDVIDSIYLYLLLILQSLNLKTNSIEPLTDEKDGVAVANAPIKIE